MATTTLSPCAAQVRRDDPDRYLATLFAPAEAREDLFALHALNDELARAGEVATEPLIGAMRLQWWRDALDGIDAGTPRRHPIVEALARGRARAVWTRPDLEALIDGRTNEEGAPAVPDLRSLEAHVAATAAVLAGLALDGLGVRDAAVRRACRHAALAYGLVGVLRSVPADARRGRVLLPRDLMAQRGLEPERIAASAAREARAAVTASVAELAGAHLLAARSTAIRPEARRALPVLLWATFARWDLRHFARVGYDPVAPSLTNPSGLRRLYVAWHGWRGRF
ncbi:MAG: squalene/phytoene synthase family protein [Alphaproteobacteria bacterium]|nr:squalene/phytoene synthase family protein [Alphaproteobacteria bacterium]